jgi:tetratricopeptide (TPR) repeat protein
MRTLDEILRTMEGSSLFVFFLSQASLDSDWVKREITEAKRLSIEGKIKRIYPIIIDRTVTHSDPRIPDWMRDEYNLHPVSRPTIAVRRIQQRLRELSWEAHPRLKERQKIFVGRNDEIGQFEERFDDYSLSPPTCVICSGLPLIGRKTLLRHALAKAASIRDSYSPPEIILTPQDSVEDFIVKVYDLGFSENTDTTDLLHKSLDEKIKLASKLCNDLVNLNELLIIEDTGGLVTYERTIVHWFIRILDALADNKKLTLAVASRFRPNFGNQRRPDIFYVAVPELSKSERMGLFKRVAEFEKLSLKIDDYAYFENLLYGFPDQVLYAVNLIKELGLPTAKRKTDLLVDFNSDRAALLVALNAPEDHDKALLYLLSEFDFISYDFLASLVDLQHYEKTLERFLASAMAESLGANGEYIRLNDAVRDYVRRLRIPLPPQFEMKLREHVDTFVKAQDSEDIDASDYLFSVRRALTEGKQIDSKLLIPSHFLKAMKDLYDRHRSYREVITLADRVLESKTYLDPNITREILYFLCLSLARLKQHRFLVEVQHVGSPEHDFLMGFYYRMCGRTDEAIQRQLKAVKETRTASRARRELVQLYVNIEDFEAARTLAELNYKERPSNPFHIQAYLKCIINSPNWKANESTIQKLLSSLEDAQQKFERAEEMRLNALSQYQAYCLLDYQKALQTIDDAIAKFPNNPYPLFTKINILFRQKTTPDVIESVLRNIESTIQSEAIFRDALLKLRAQLLYLQGNDAEAEKVIKPFLMNVPENIRQVVNRKLQGQTASVGLEDD